MFKIANEEDVMFSIPEKGCGWRDGSSVKGEAHTQKGDWGDFK